MGEGTGSERVGSVTWRDSEEKEKEMKKATTETKPPVIIVEDDTVLATNINDRAADADQQPWEYEDGLFGNMN